MSRTYKQGVVIPVNGRAFVDSFTNLADYQRAVGGYIEAVSGVSDHWDVVVLVNEDGRSTGLPFNRAASALIGQPLVGTVVFIGGPDDDGEWTDLQWELQDALMELAS